VAGLWKRARTHACTNTHPVHTWHIFAYSFLAPNILIKFLPSLYPRESKTDNGWSLLEFCVKRPSQRYFSFPLLLGFGFFFFFLLNPYASLCAATLQIHTTTRASVFLSVQQGQKALAGQP